MTNELLARFIEDGKSAVNDIMNDLSSDETREYFLLHVHDFNDRLADKLEGYGWDRDLIDEELTEQELTMCKDAMLKYVPLGDSEEGDDDYYGDEDEIYDDDLSDEHLNEIGCEIVVWPESQYITDFPGHIENARLIVDEAYGYNAFVVDCDWLDNFRDDEFYPY